MMKQRLPGRILIPPTTRSSAPLNCSRILARSHFNVGAAALSRPASRGHAAAAFVATKAA
jgi:hypothetical protein